MMKRTILTLILLIVVPVAASSRQQAEAGEPPPLKVFRAINNRTVRLDNYRGRVVLINFWATWCPPCRAEMPELIKLQKKYGAKLQVVGITYPPESPGDVRRLARRLKVNYPLVMGTRETARQFGIGEVLPLTIIIARDGVVRDRIVGILEPEEFDEKVKPLLP